MQDATKFDNIDNHFPQLEFSDKKFKDEESQMVNVTASGRRGLRSRLKDAEFRQKLLRTIWLCFAFLALGISNAQRGPAILDLQIITNTDIQQASAFFTAGSAGFVTGALLLGLVYDLLSKSLSLILGLVGMAVLTGATPFCRQFGGMVAAIVISSIFEGGVDTVGNADVIRLWGSEGGMAMQAIHFSFALGGVIAPLITEPFLAPRAEEDESNTTSFNCEHVQDFAGGRSPHHRTFLSNVAFSNYTDLVNNDPLFANNNDFSESYLTDLHSQNSSLSNHVSTGNVTYSDDIFLKTRVHFAFIICGIFTIFPAIPLTAVYVWHTILNKQKMKLDSTSTKQENKRQKHEKDDTERNIEAATILLQRTDKDNAVNYKEYNDILEYGRDIHKHATNNKENRHDGDSDTDNQNNCSIKRTETADDSGNEMTKQDSPTIDGLPQWLYFCLLAWVCVFFMLYSSIEDTVANYLTTYVVMQLDWSKSDGAMVASVFWGSFAATRFVCIWVSGFVSSVRLLTTCCVLMVLSFAAFLLASLLAVHWAVWAATAITGAAMSAIFPGAFSWMEEELMTVTGRNTSVIMLAASLGLIVSPLVLGHLLETRGAIWLAYVLLGEAVACLITFILLLVFARTRLKTIQKTRHQHVVSVHITNGEQQEKLLDSPDGGQTQTDCHENETSLCDRRKADHPDSFVSRESGEREKFSDKKNVVV